MEKRNPLVSMIVRTKDRPRLVKTALESIAAQTYRPIEVVLVNDGGCDLAVEELRGIIGTVSLNYRKLEKTTGRAHAGNVGLAEAKGEYIAFLDDDDELYPDHLMILVASLEQTDYRVAYTDAELIAKELDQESGIITIINKRVFSSYDFSYNDLVVGNYIPLNTLLFSREALEKSGGFDEGFDLYEDWDLLLRIGREHPFRHVKKVTAIYNQWSGSDQIAQGDGAGDAVKSAFARITRKHHASITPEVILNLKQKQESLAADLRDLIGRYQSIEQELSGRCFELSQKETELARKDAELIHQDAQLTRKDEELARKEMEISALQDMNTASVAAISAMQSTLGWRLLTKVRNLRERFLPMGSKRRDVYQRVVGSIKKRGIKGTLTRAFEEMPSVRRDILHEYHTWLGENEPDEAALQRQREESGLFPYRPLISVIVPVYDTDKDMLLRMIESVFSQTYENWQLCVADGNSADPAVREVLQSYSERDGRIKVKFLDENRRISGNANAALTLAEGEFAGFLDHDDELSPFALYEVVRLLNEDPFADLIYSDEDKLDSQGHRTSPFFKPDWSPDLLLSVNYICHFSVLRRDLLEGLKGFREGYEGAQDYDLFLRAGKRAARIAHIPKILYHWRVHEKSTSGDVSRKDYADAAGRAALADLFEANNIDAYVVSGNAKTNYVVRYRIKDDPLVSIIIPFRDKAELLENCLNSILRKTTYKRYEVILVSNKSEEEKTFQYLDSIKDDERIRVLHFDEAFNFSRINNFAVRAARGDYLLFLNNDTEVITEDWLTFMLEQAQRKEVGAVGCKLLFPDKTIQHAGVVVGLSGFAGHVFSGLPDHSYTYFGSTDFVRDVLAVTGACVMVKRELFEKAGGFNESFIVCGSDVDFCLRIAEMGFRNVYTPYAVLYHYESASRGAHIPADDFRVSADSYGKFLDGGDPYYNPNLTLMRTDCSLRTPGEDLELKRIIENALL
jgi:glycosyltransferase involved in cell wall biosynthesis